MAKFTINEDATEYVRMLESLGENVGEAIGRVMYPAAGILFKEVRSNIDGIPVRHGGWGTADRPLEGITAAQKKGLQESVGITKLGKKDGYYSFKVGFDGYNSTDTKKKENGSKKSSEQKQPNVVVARSIESGTSWLKKHPFVAPAVRRVRDKCIDEMQKQYNEDLEKMGF